MTTLNNTMDSTAFVDMARDVGERCAPHAARHDRDGTFVTEAYEAMADSGYLRLAVPEELGGFGASVRQVCEAEAELARHCASSALAAAMHLYNTLVLRHRYRRGAADAEAALRRVASEGLVVATSGGSDWLWPTTEAVPVDGGFRITGRKVFCSQAPAGGVLTTSAVIGPPVPDAEVIHFSLPMTADGVRIVETWDTLGMRGTASHDLVIDDVFVPAERIVERRPWGHLGAGLEAAMTYFGPLVAAVYWGAAAGARDRAVEAIATRRRGADRAADTSAAQRQVGLMDVRLRVAWWALLGAVDELGDTPQPGPATTVTVMTAKRECVLAAAEVTALAMEVAGGGSYFRTSPLERAFRDVRAGVFHPLTPEATLAYAGRVALGGDTSVA